MLWIRYGMMIRKIRWSITRTQIMLSISSSRMRIDFIINYDIKYRMGQN